MSEPNKPSILELLQGVKIGAAATVTDRKTKEETAVTLPTPDILKNIQTKPIDDTKPHSAVSAEIEFSRNMTFNKIGIKVWISMPVNRGDELIAQDAIVHALHNQAVEYVDNGAVPILEEWARQRNGG